VNQVVEYRPELFDWLADHAANLPYSQFGEDGIVSAIFDKIGTTTRFCIEVGASDGLFFSNTRRLIEDGWSALLIEADEAAYERCVSNNYKRPDVFVENCKIEPRGPNSLDSLWSTQFAETQQPDLLIIDIDGQDCYILNTLEKLKPRVLLVEYNPDVDPMYMPVSGGEGQAGLQVMQYIAVARGFLPIVRTEVNLVCVQKPLAGMLAQI
jgi:hypothetical protein